VYCCAPSHFTFWHFVRDMYLHLYVENKILGCIHIQNIERTKIAILLNTAKILSLNQKLDTTKLINSQKLTSFLNIINFDFHTFGFIHIGLVYMDDISLTLLIEAHLYILLPEIIQMHEDHVFMSLLFNSQPL
ncbi:hypothetical protein ACJX0J_037690, partial [Zea mays]